MILDAETLERRRQHVCASEAAVLMGCDPWRRTDWLWKSKVEGVKQRPNAAMQIGHDRENGLLDGFARRTGKTLGERQVERIRGVWLATPDALVLGERAAVDAKTSGFGKARGSTKLQPWQIHWSDGVPENYVWQFQAQMYVHELERVYVEALLAWISEDAPVSYVVERDDAKIAQLVERGTRFMECVRAGTKPVYVFGEWVIP